MRFNKTVLAGLLLCLYLVRAGRAKLSDISANLNISQRFLEQVARKLRLASVIKSTRGPGGGYTLMDDITMIDVMYALNPNGYGFIDSTLYQSYTIGVPEERALSSFIYNLSLSISSLTVRQVKNVMNEKIANEMTSLERANEKGMEN